MVFEAFENVLSDPENLEILGIDSETMRNHLYNLEVGESGSLLVRWHDQRPMELFGKARWYHTQHTFSRQMTLLLRPLYRNSLDVIIQVKG